MDTSAQEIGSFRRAIPRRRYAGLVDPDLTPKQVAELLGSDHDLQLVDVREPHEVDAGRIAGGRHIELGRLSAEADTIDRERPVVFYCRSGARSGMATDAFRSAGFDAHNMTGGLLEWDAAGLPLEPDHGYVAEP
jgi:rhodanese-related sulfurtransferase